MNNVYERLIHLFEETGLDTEEGSYAEAEAYSLAKGIAFVKEYLTYISERMFFTMNGKEESVEKYADMLRLDYTKTDRETLENAIKARLKNSYTDAALSENYDAEAAIMKGLTVNEESEAYVISGIDSDTVFFLGNFIKGAVPFDKCACLTGSGLTFKKWDSFKKTAGFYNRLRLPFSCFDTMEDGIF